MKYITSIITIVCSSITLHGQTTTPEVVITKKESISTSPVDRPGKWWQKRHQNQVKNANTNTEKCDLVFIGDSITQGWEGAGKQLWDQHFNQWNALNLGISGDRTEHVIWRLQNGAFPKALKPKVAVVMIGTNNTGHAKGQPAAETAAGITLIIDEIHNRSPKTQIILNAIFARRATPQDKKRLLNDAINKIISDLGKRDYVHYLDINSSFLDKDGNLPKLIMPDLLHPKADGYKIWANSILPKIKDLMIVPLTSTNGFIAKFVPSQNEGEGKTEIWKAGKKVVEITDSRPFSFSPKKDILLLKEHSADDDTRFFLLNIGEGELKMTGNRNSYIFGGRFADSANWSQDGTTITLKYFAGMSDKQKETFKVKALLKR